MKKILLPFIISFFLAAELSASWERIAFTGSYVPSILLKDNSLYTLVDTVFYRSDDNGESWDSTGFLNARFIEDFAYVGDIFFAAATWVCGGCLASPCIYRSKDNGATWESVYASETGAGVITENQGVVFANVEANLFASFDYGTTWTKVKSDSSAPSRFDVLFSYKGVLYSSTYSEGIFKTADNGLTWSMISGNLPKLGTYHIAANDSFLFVSESNRVYRSDEGGLNWQSAGAALPDKVVHLISNGQYLCAAYRKTIYLSQNNGLSWTNISDGFHLRDYGHIKDMVLNGNYLFVATSNDGIWRYDLSTAVKVEASRELNKPDLCKLEQNYPNPFNPSTNISYQLSTMSRVTLKVFDILGREVVTLLDEQKEAGYYSLLFEGSRLASGIYFVRLVAQSEEGKPFVQTRKLLLMK